MRDADVRHDCPIVPGHIAAERALEPVGGRDEPPQLLFKVADRQVAK